MLSDNKVIDFFIWQTTTANIFLHIIILEHSPGNNNR